MACALRQPLLSLSTKLFQQPQKMALLHVLKNVTSPQIATRGMTLNRTLWCAASNNSYIKTTQKHKHNKLCCRYLHTEGDQKLVSFLGQEITDEKKLGSVNTVQGWDIKTDGTGVILSKKFNDELIKVEFDVNNSVESTDPYIEGEEEGELPSLQSRPPFEVEVKKKSGRRLRFFCEFTAQEPRFDADDVGEAGPQESIDDLFNIVEVRIDDDKKSGEFDKTYTHSSAVMDGTLYDMLMDMLDERGIDEDFVNNLVDFATSYERNLYIKFLEDMKEIISEK